jgi:hypothetical protein
VPPSVADRPAGRRPRSRSLAILALALLALAGSGCTTVRVTATTRSSIEQRLITRALERAAARLDVRPLRDRVVGLELYTLTADQGFAREFFRARLEARGIRIARGADADVTLQVFAAALAVDTAETLLGLPAMQTPVLAVPIPEIALFKWERSRGHAEVQSYLYDPGGRLIERVSDALGEATWDRFTILIFVSFAITDIDRPPPEP